MEEFSSDISVIDVYELASAIGKEFEKIIDVCGADTVTNLMPKVINSLEHLESLATKNERENTILEDLRGRIVKLENDKHIKAEERSKFEKELEQIEEEWRKESNHLLTVIAKLQDENKRLTTILANKSFLEEDVALESENMNVVNRLQHQVDQLREKIKMQNAELNNKNNEIDNLGSQIENLNSTIVDLSRKQKLHATQIQGFIDERTKLLIEVQDQRREIHMLHQRLGIVQQENEDLVKSNVDSPDLRNKILYDVDDPERPRFTASELKEILHERNELKAKLNELQDELTLYKLDSSVEAQEEDTESEYYLAGRRGRSDVYLALRFPDRGYKKGESFQQSIPSFFPSNVTSLTKSQLATELNETFDEDLPVQGPLPLEPDDAPWKRSESNIRRLFRKLFLDKSGSSVTRITVPIFSSKTSSSSSPTASAASNTALF